MKVVTVIRHYSHNHDRYSIQTVGINDPVPAKGTQVDAISYYTRELAESNKDVFVMQRRQIQVAETGNASVRASDWLSMIADYAAGAATTILDDSEVDNDLLSPHDSFADTDGSIPQAERMTSMYGSIMHGPRAEIAKSPRQAQSSKRASLGPIPTFSSDTEISFPTLGSVGSDDKSYPLLTQDEMVSAAATAVSYVIAPTCFDNLESFNRYSA